MMVIQPAKVSAALRKARTEWLKAIQDYRDQVLIYTAKEISADNKPLIMSPSAHTRLIQDIRSKRDAYDDALKAQGRPVPRRKP